jgi:hypothetical protein
MTRDGIRNSCGSVAGAVEDYPIWDDVVVFMVSGRMFALMSPEGDAGCVKP